LHKNNAQKIKIVLARRSNAFVERGEGGGGELFMRNYAYFMQLCACPVADFTALDIHLI
jgi:hypothetical protein